MLSKYSLQYCYGKGIVGKMFIAPNSLRPMVTEIQRIWKIHKFMYSTLRSAYKASKRSDMSNLFLSAAKWSSYIDWPHLSLSEMDQHRFVSVSQKHFVSHNQRQLSVIAPSLSLESTLRPGRNSSLINWTPFHLLQQSGPHETCSAVQRHKIASK